MIEIENLDAFCAALEAEIADIEREFDRKFVAYVSGLLEEAANASPQWSGNFAANWRMNLYPVYSYIQFRGKGPVETPQDAVSFRGDTEAVFEAMWRNAPMLRQVHLDKEVFIGNATPYGEEVAENQLAATGEPFLRPGNYIDPRPYPLGVVSERADDIFRKA